MPVTERFRSGTCGTAANVSVLAHSSRVGKLGSMSRHVEFTSGGQTVYKCVRVRQEAKSSLTLCLRLTHFQNVDTPRHEDACITLTEGEPGIAYLPHVPPDWRAAIRTSSSVRESPREAFPG